MITFYESIIYKILLGTTRRYFFVLFSYNTTPSVSTQSQSVDSYLKEPDNEFLGHECPWRYVRLK